MIKIEPHLSLQLFLSRFLPVGVIGFSCYACVFSTIVYFPVDTRMIMFFPVLIWVWLSINSLFVLMKIVFIYRAINV